MTERHTDPRPRLAVGPAGGLRFEPIDEVGCWSLLARATVGRVAVVVEGATDIFPVNLAVDRPDDRPPAILFRTAPGTKLAGLGRDPRISIEVDDLDLDDHTGWSIVVKGEARQVREIADAAERRRIESLFVDNWDDAPKRHWIRLEPTQVTGRRIGTATLPVDLRSDHLPTLDEWTDRDVWVPPAHAGAGL
jgi:nitroimidazol reductase NimA-like FMN-containing flavoprotein (pyridoxamine 5'-phosphate oxidase superfamily)